MRFIGIPCHRLTPRLMLYTQSCFDPFYITVNDLSCTNASTSPLECVGKYGPSLASSSATPADKAAVGMKNFWEKNRELNRPLSPHLSVYKFPLPPVMSITHRITGAVLTVAMYIGPLVYLAGSMDFAGYIAMIQSWGMVGTGLVQVTKFSLAFSFAYHFVNGIRHLLWDYAAKLKLDQVYKSGYVVIATTLLMTLGLMML